MVRYEMNGRVAVMQIDRPSARNAIDGEVARGLEAAVDRLEADEEAWVGVLAGVGPVFCAGADLKLISAGRGAELRTERGGFGGFVQRERSKPIIAAIEGPALAGGCELALACDLIVASRSSSFGLPEVKRSLLAAAGGLFRLPRALPLNVAMEMALTGSPLEAERAHQLGLVNTLVEPGEALTGGLLLAQRIAQNGPQAVREARRIVRMAVASDEAQLWKEGFEAFARLSQTEDFVEGPRAFIEKRNPVYKGR